MPFLYLIRHPRTRPDPAVPSSLWELAPEGRAQVRALIAAPFWGGVVAVYTSQEAKTTAVGDAIHARHGIPVTAVTELGEAGRDVWAGGDAFYSAQRRFFSSPGAPPVPGWESADSARTHFVTAMDAILARHPLSESLAVVSHATVLTLYAAHLRGEAPTVEAWSRLGFMDVMAVDRATLRPATGFLPPPYHGLP